MVRSIGDEIDGDTHIQAQGQEMKREKSSPCLPYILFSQY